MKKYYDLWNLEYDYPCGSKFEHLGNAYIVATGKCRRHSVVEVTENEAGKKSFKSVPKEEIEIAYQEAKKMIDDFFAIQIIKLQAFLDENNIPAKAEKNCPTSIDLGVRSININRRQWNKIKRYLNTLGGTVHYWTKYEQGVPEEKRNYYQMCCRFNLTLSVFGK